MLALVRLLIENWRIRCYERWVRSQEDYMPREWQRPRNMVE